MFSNDLHRADFIPLAPDARTVKACRIDPVLLHAENMDRIAHRLRTNARELLQTCRRVQTEQEIHSMRGLYLTAENTEMKRNLAQTLRLYRQAMQDLQAMRRVIKTSHGHKQTMGNDQGKEQP